MEKFIIKKIEADFDERWLRVKKIDNGKEFGIYFMEFSEDVFMINNIKYEKKSGRHNRRKSIYILDNRI